MNSTESSSYNQLQKSLFDLTGSESYHIINMLSYHFKSDTRPSQSEARSLYKFYFSESKQDDAKGTAMKWNLYLILIFILADAPYNSSTELKAELFQRFTSIPPYMFYSKLNQFDIQIARIDFALIINKLEFLYRYSSIIQGKDLAIKLRESLSEIYMKLGSNDNDLYMYYIAISFFLENNFDAALEALKKLNILEVNNSTEVKVYLQKRVIILMSLLERGKRNLNNEQAWLNMLKSPNNSSELNVRLHLNIADSLYIKFEVEDLYVLLSQLNWYLKSKAITGSSNLVTNFTEVSIIVKLRLMYCNSLLYDKSLDQHCSTLKELDEYFMIISESQDHNKYSTSNLPILFKSKNCYFSDNFILGRITSNLQVFYIFYKKIYGEEFNSGPIDTLLKNNQEMIKSLSKELLLNMLMIKPNDGLLNRVFNEKIGSYYSKQSSIQIVDVFLIYNKIVSLMTSLISDSSKVKRSEYIKSICDLCEIALKVESYDSKSPFIRNVISNIYFAYSFSHYANEDYYTASKLLSGISDENISESYRIIKLKADIAYKTKDYKEALKQNYQAILAVNRTNKTTNNSQVIGILHFNCGLTHLILGELSKAKEKFKSSMDSLESIDKKTISDQETLKEIKSLYLLLE